MGKNRIILILITCTALFLVVLGLHFYSPIIYDKKGDAESDFKETPEIVSTDKQKHTVKETMLKETNNFQLDNKLTNDQLVSFSHLGCSYKNLFVLSVSSGQVPVDKNGNYKADFSTSNAHPVFLINEKNEPCASAISIPEYSGKISFDAKSTVKATIFQTIGILTSDPKEAKERLLMIEQLKSFPALYSYTETNLPKLGLTNLAKDKNFENLLSKSIEEISLKLLPDFHFESE